MSNKNGASATNGNISNMNDAAFSFSPAAVEEMRPRREQILIYPTTEEKQAVQFIAAFSGTSNNEVAHRALSAFLGRATLRVNGEQIPWRQVYEDAMQNPEKYGMELVESETGLKMLVRQGASLPKPRGRKRNAVAN